MNASAPGEMNAITAIEPDQAQQLSAHDIAAEIIRSQPKTVLTALTQQQLKLLCFFLDDPKRSKTSAALHAGYSKRGASQTGSRTLDLPNVKAAMGEIMAERAKRARYSVTFQRVAEALAVIAFTGLSRFMKVNQDTGLPEIDFRGASEAEIDALAEITVDTITVTPAEGDPETRTKVKIKPIDRMRALENLADHVGFGAAKPDDAPDIIALLLREIAARGSAAPLADRAARAKKIPSPPQPEDDD